MDDEDKRVFEKRIGNDLSLTLTPDSYLQAASYERETKMSLAYQHLG